MPNSELDFVAGTGTEKIVSSFQARYVLIIKR